MDARAPESKALLCAYHPQQLLPGLAAVIELRRHLKQPHDAPVTLLVWSDPGVGEHFLGRRRRAFEILLQAFPWVTLDFLSSTDVKASFSPVFRVRGKARWLRQRYGADAFGAVHYAHDIGSDFLAQSAMQAFPHAKRACFGDALGVVYSNDYYSRLTYPLASFPACLCTPRKTLTHLFWRLLRTYTLPLRSARLDPEFAVLILPCDPGGDFFPGKTLMPVERETLEQVLQGLAQGAGVTHDKSYVQMHLMLLGSYCESGFNSEDEELALYVDSARQHVPTGEPILLKAHPASFGTKVERLAGELSKRHPVTVLGDNAIPIEAMRHLAHCRSVISFSYSSVSLHYLYGSNVVHALTMDMIERHFPPASRPWIRDSNTLYLNQLSEAMRLRHQQLHQAAALAHHDPNTVPEN